VNKHHLLKLLPFISAPHPYIKPSVINCPWLYLGQLSMLGLDIWTDMKTAM